MASVSPGSGSRWLDFLLLAFLAFVVYNANLRLIGSEDSFPARLLPFNLVLHRTFYLDPWIDPYVPTAPGPAGIYFVTKVGTHWLSVYPVTLPVVITPLYVYPALWLSRLKVDPAAGSKRNLATYIDQPNLQLGALVVCAKGAN